VPLLLHLHLYIPLLLWWTWENVALIVFACLL
jgi:hypothetical protein